MDDHSSSTTPINVYGQQLSKAQIAAGVHRELVGGLWEEVGRLQLEFLKARGLQPGHTLVDVGCGALRGGLHFIRYLDDAHYCGLDANRSLIEAGKVELAAAGLSARAPRLLVTETFDMSQLGISFDYAIAVSLFTHLPMEQIARCLVEVSKVLRPSVGRFYASFFQAARSAHAEPIRHSPGGVITYFGKDPFHYSVDELKTSADSAAMNVELVGDWQHPRHQQMLCFSTRS